MDIIEDTFDEFDLKCYDNYFSVVKDALELWHQTGKGISFEMIFQILFAKMIKEKLKKEGKILISQSIGKVSIDDNNLKQAFKSSGSSERYVLPDITVIKKERRKEKSHK